LQSLRLVRGTSIHVLTGCLLKATSIDQPVDLPGGGGAA
jgi:hypothetical protein